MDEEESSVDKLQRRLYQYGDAPIERTRRELHEEAYDVPTSWMGQEDVPEQQAFRSGSLEEYAMSVQSQATAGNVPAYLRNGKATKAVTEARRKQHLVRRVVRAIFLTSLAFFVLSAGVAGYFFFNEQYQISCDNIEIDVTGPLSVPSGKELVLDVGVLNKNPTPIQLAELAISYPEGTRSAQDASINLTTARERMGTIEAGERVRTSVSALLFGKEQSEYSIDLTVEYRVDESNAVFQCNAQHKVVISTAPVSLVVDGLEEVSSGQEFALTLSLNSNSEETVHDQRLVADYPFGFEFVRSEPAPTNGVNVWEVGDIAPGGKRTIVVYGVVNTSTVESRSIKFRLGEQKKDSSDALLTTMQLVEHPFLVSKPFLALNLSVNGSSDPEVPATLGNKIFAELSWENTLPYTIYDVEIEAVLDSPLIKQTSIGQGSGYYRSVDHTLIWTGQTLPVFKSMTPGDTGNTAFSFSTVSLGQNSGALEPNLTIAFVVRARRVSDDKVVTQKLVAQSERLIKFNSQLEFQSETLFAIGPFVNSGAHPPVADHETTYTVHWALLNSTNDIDSVRVEAEIPINVRWLNTMRPEDGSLLYNPATHVVTWSPGTVPAGTGARLPEREVYFQVALLPSVTDKVENLTIIGDASLTGIDRYTNSVIKIKNKSPGVAGVE